MIEKSHDAPSDWGQTVVGDIIGLRVVVIIISRRRGGAGALKVLVLRRGIVINNFCWLAIHRKSIILKFTRIDIGKLPQAGLTCVSLLSYCSL